MYPIDNCHFCRKEFPTINTLTSWCADKDCYKKHCYRIKFRIVSRHKKISSITNLAVLVPRVAEFIYFKIGEYEFIIDYNDGGATIVNDPAAPMELIFPGIKFLTIDNYLSQVQKMKDLMIFS